MKLKTLKIFFIFSIGFLFFTPLNYGLAVWADHLVISEVQITGGPGKTTNDFIEIYNPTESVVDLSGWKLRKRTQSGNESSIKVFSEGKSIPAHGYFLWASSKDGYDQIIGADESSKQTVADNNSIALFDATGNLIDALAWGSGHINPFFEGTTTSTLANPGANQSLERKPGGNDGNGEDTNDNYNDFLSPATSNPQNSKSPPLPPISGPSCGNNTKETGEDCDGTDLGGQTCVSKGFIGGTLSCSISCTFDTSNCTRGGGGGYSSPPSNTTSPSDVVINEFVSDPIDGESEWIELYNNKNEKINLENWSLEDGSGTKTKLSGEIQPKGFFVVDNLKFYLNNKGDIILLKDSSGNLIDSVTYGDWNDLNRADNAVVSIDPNSTGRKKDGVDTNNDLNDFVVFLSPTKGKANSISDETKNNTTVTNVYLNEVLPNPIGDDEAGEFIELKNFSDSNVDLTGWSIKDASGAGYTISSQDFSTTFILAKGFFILPRTITKISLNNSNGESIKLYNQNQQLVDSLEYNEVAKENYAYAKDKDKNWRWTNQPTLGKENIFSETSSEGEKDKSVVNDLEEFSKIIINEVLPNPEGSDIEEWLEIYNSGDKEVNLKNWQIDDQEGGSKAYKISKDLIIKPSEYLIFKKEETKISFNNDGDSVRLISPAGKIISEIFYEDAESGYSYARINDDWFWTKVLTPGSANIIDFSKKSILETESENQEVQEVRIENIRKLENGTKVKTRGVVSVGPGILGSQIFYLAGSGIQVYFYKKDFPSLRIGDLLEINGEISEYRGETRIKIAQKSDIRLIKRNQEVKIHRIKIEEIDENLEGELVMVEGQLIESRGNYLYLDDGTDEIKVYLKTTTGIKKPKMKEGDLIKITGIISQNNDEYRLLPRFQEDIEIIKKEETEKSKETAVVLAEALGSLSGENNLFGKINNLENTKYLLVSALALLLILVGLLIKKKK